MSPRLTALGIVDGAITSSMEKVSIRRSTCTLLAAAALLELR